MTINAESIWEATEKLRITLKKENNITDEEIAKSLDLPSDYFGWDKDKQIKIHSGWSMVKKI